MEVSVQRLGSRRDLQISEQSFGANTLDIVTGQQLEPAESIDLGIIDISRKERPKPRVSRPADITAKATVDNMISGVVIGSDGKRVPNAKFYWMSYRSYELEPTPPRLVATANDKGEFKFANPIHQIAHDAPASWGYYQYIVVKAPGHGFSFERPGDLLRQARENQTLVGSIASAIKGVQGAVVTLPPAGNPLRGRVVDIDGNAVANASVRIRWFDDPRERLFRVESENFAECTPEKWTELINRLIKIVEPSQAIDVFLWGRQMPMAASKSRMSVKIGCFNC